MSNIKFKDEEKLFNSVLEFNTKIFGLILGILFGSIIFIATNWLVLKGGHVGANGEVVIGPHLQLLSQFFIGYRVSFFGSIIGFAYGFAVGTLSGSVISYIYNWIISRRN